MLVLLPHTHCLVSNIACLTYLALTFVYSPASIPTICSSSSTAPTLHCFPAPSLPRTPWKGKKVNCHTDKTQETFPFPTGLPGSSAPLIPPLPLFNKPVVCIALTSLSRVCQTRTNDWRWSSQTVQLRIPLRGWSALFEQLSLHSHTLSLPLSLLWPSLPTIRVRQLNVAFFCSKFPSILRCNPKSFPANVLK